MEFPNLSDALAHIRTISGPEARRNELRHKQQEDIDLIRARTAHDHQEPFWFLILEANDIWRRVFDYITEPSDITSAYHTCTMFRDHLHKKWNKISLLPKVFRVLRERKYFHFLDYYDVYSPKYSEDILDENEGLLSHRLVSKSWNQALEEALLEPPEYSQPDWHLNHPTNARYERFDRGCIRVKLRLIDDVNNALEALRPPQPQTHSALLRWIDVSNRRCQCQDQLQERFYARVGQFMELHGGSVWILKMTQHIHYFDDDSFDYKNLCKLVRHTPNLKELDLLVFGERDEMCNGEKMRFAQGVQEFPILPSLSRLLICFHGYINQPVLHEIVKSNPGIKALSITWPRRRDFNNPRLISTLGMLSKLECLEMVCQQLTMEDIQPLVEVEWPLLKILLFLSRRNIFDGRPTPRVSARKFFRFLSHFNTSLVEVKAQKTLWNVVDDGEDDDDDGRSLVIDFPNVQTITFHWFL